MTVASIVAGKVAALRASGHQRSMTKFAPAEKGQAKLARSPGASPAQVRP
jgi:hypothetical protein